MRVVLAVLTSGGLSGGFAKYLRCLLPRLRSEPLVSELRVFAPPLIVESLRDQGCGEVQGWREGDDRSGFRVLAQELRLARPDVLFVPTARALADVDVPQVVMVRNMEPFEQPFAGLGLRGALTNAGRLLAAHRACRRAAHVIAVSRHVADVVEQRLLVPHAKLAVVSHGVDPPPDDPGLAPASAPGGDRPFLFTAGSIRPARGLDDVVDALALAGRSAPLVLVAGAPDADSAAYDRRLRAKVRRLGLEDRLCLLGRIGEAEMRWCFRHATAFVMTSRAEACPNAALEALANGCVVLSTDHPPMPEVLGEAARYYRARDAGDLARQMRVLFADPRETREALGRAARLRAGLFTWEKTTRGTVEVLETAVRTAQRRNR